MAEGETADDHSSSLCTSCGFCCSGILFDHVPVNADERERLIALGFRLYEEDSQTRFSQQCAMFKKNLCGVYADRPVACSRYRCELLKRYEAGEISREEADSRVGEAKRLIAELRPLLDKHGLQGSAMKHWYGFFTDWQSRHPDERGDAGEGEVLVKLALLNLILDRHFRSGSQRTVDRLDLR